MSNVNLEDLSLQEEEGFVFDLEEGEEEVVDFRWCLVGRFLGDRSIHVNSMKATMADIWRPVKGVKIKEATTGLFLFQFAHELDMEAVLQGGPWSFNNQMLIIERVQLGVQIDNIPLNHVDFWVQVHNLPTGLMAERVGKTLANYIGSFVEYDKNNKGSFWREYMRLKVRVDVRQPLKKESRVKNQGGEWCTVKFKYEKLGVFCFVCGIVGHGENKCSVRFSMAVDDGTRSWSKELRAEPRRRNGRNSSRWLLDDDNGRSEPEERIARDSGGAQVDPTTQHTAQPRRPVIAQNSLSGPILVPVTTTNQHDLAHQMITHSKPVPAITASAENNNSHQLIISQPVNQHSISNPYLQPNNYVPDNTIITQSLPDKNNSSTSLTYSPIITAALNQNPSQLFAFNANPLPDPKHVATHVTRPGKNILNLKSNPNHKLIQAKNILLQPRPKNDPVTPCFNQIPSETMEIQTEKKRRRDNEKESDETSVVTQHFLTVGPGSQACRDQ
jgi:14-3-3 protein epsilon